MQFISFFFHLNDLAAYVEGDRRKLEGSRSHLAAVEAKTLTLEIEKNTQQVVVQSLEKTRDELTVEVGVMKARVIEEEEKVKEATIRATVASVTKYLFLVHPPIHDTQYNLRAACAQAQVHAADRQSQVKG